MVQFRWIPESIRWLRVKNKTEKAEEILRTLAEQNRRTFPNVKLIEVTEEDSNASIKEMFTNNKLLRDMALHGAIW